MTLGTLILLLVIIGLVLPLVGVPFDARVSRILTIVLVVLLVLLLVGVFPHTRTIF